MNTRQIIAAIQAGTRITINKFGDGEYSAMQTFLGKSKVMLPNKEKHSYFPELGEQLLEFVKEGDPLILLPDHLLKDVDFNRFLATYGNPQSTYYRADQSLYQDARESNLGGFLRVLRDSFQTRVYVSAQYRLPKVFNHFIQTPEKDSFLSLDKTESQIVNSNPDLVVISNGLCAPILTHRLTKLLPDTTILNVGSLFDPLYGKQITRSYHRGYDLGKYNEFL